MLPYMAEHGSRKTRLRSRVHGRTCLSTMTPASVPVEQLEHALLRGDAARDGEGVLVLVLDILSEIASPRGLRRGRDLHQHRQAWGGAQKPAKSAAVGGGSRSRWASWLGEAARSSSRGGGWAPSGPVSPLGHSPWECRAAWRCQARPAEAQAPGPATAWAGRSAMVRRPSCSAAGGIAQQGRPAGRLRSPQPGSTRLQVTGCRTIEDLGQRGEQELAPPR